MLPISPTAPLPALAAQVLTWIGEGGLASAEQLAHRFSLQARPRSACRYLHPLIQAGYLATAPQTILGRGRTVYTLTAAGSVALGLAPPLVRVGWPHPQELPHLLLGQEVRLLLETRLAQAGQGGHILAWRTDYLLRHLARLAPAQVLPDIQVEFCRRTGSPAELLAVEIDGAYFGARLHHKLAAYGAGTTPVLWVCLPSRAAHLRQVAGAYPHVEVLPLVLPDSAGGRR